MLQAKVDKSKNIFEAARSGDLVTLEWLLKEGGASIQDEDEGGNTALLIAVGQGDWPLVRWLLLQEDPGPIQVKITKKEGLSIQVKNTKFGYDTALLQATHHGHLEILKLLLEKGASLNENKFFNSILNIFISFYLFGGLSIIVLGLLLVLLVTVTCGVFLMPGLFTALLLCSEIIISTMVLNECKKVLDKELDVNRKYQSLLLIAAEQGHLDIVQWLLTQGKARISEKYYYDGNTGLLLATKKGHLDVVQWLLSEGGANLEERNDAGETAFDIAKACKGQSPMLLFLSFFKKTMAINKQTQNIPELRELLNYQGEKKSELQLVALLTICQKKREYLTDEMFNTFSLWLPEVLESLEANKYHPPLGLLVSLLKKINSSSEEAQRIPALRELLDYQGEKKEKLQSIAFLILKENIRFDMLAHTYDYWLPEVLNMLLAKDKCHIIQHACCDSQWTRIASLLKHLQLTYVDLVNENDFKSLPLLKIAIALGDDITDIKCLINRQRLDMSNEAAINGAKTLAKEMSHTNIEYYLANQQRQYKREQAFQVYLAQQKRIRSQQFGHDVLTDQLKAAIAENVQELPVLKHQQALFDYLKTLSDIIKTSQIKCYNEFIQFIYGCKLPHELLIFATNYPPALRSFWYEIPPYDRCHPCFAQLNQGIEKLNQWIRELQSSSLSPIIHPHLVAIRNAYEEFIKQAIAAAKIIEPHKKLIQDNSTTLSSDLQIKLNQLIEYCLEPACLIKSETEFGFFQGRWKGYPPNVANHPCFATLQSHIDDIERYLKTFTLPANLKLALVSIQKAYEAYIQKVIVNTSVTQFNEAVIKLYFSKPCQIIGKYFPHHALTTVAEKKILSNEKSNETGQHTVVALNGVHYKHCPYAPGIEFTVGNLNAHLLGQGSPPTELLKIIDTEGKHHVYLASKSVQGTDLQYIIEQKPDWLTKINPFNFSAMVLSGFLVNHQDGKPDNFMVSYTLDKLGEVDSLDIIGIDNDIAFAYPFIRSDSGKYYVDVRNVLYFFPQIHEPLDKDFREKLIALNPEQVMIEWLRSVYYQNQNTYLTLLEQGVFHETEFKGNPKIYGQMSDAGKENPDYFSCPYEVVKKNRLGLQLPIQFVAGNSIRIYHTLKQIQNALSQDKNLTHDQLFALIQPYLHYYYQGVRIKFQNKIMRCINYLYETTNHGLQSIMQTVQPELLDRHLARGELNVCTTIAIEAASQQRSFESNRKQSIDAEIETFIAAINFSEMDERIEKLILKEMRSLNFIHHLVLWGIRVTGVELVRYFLNQDTQTQTFPQLKTLALKSCFGITLPTLNDFMTHSQLKLIELTLDDRCRALNSQDWLVLMTKEQCPKLMVYNHTGKAFIFDLYLYRDRPESYLFEMLEKGIYSEIVLGWLAEQFKRNSKPINFPCGNEPNCLHALTLQTHPHLAKLAEFLLVQNIDKTVVDNQGNTVLDKLIKRIQTLGQDTNALSMQLPYLYPLLCCFSQNKIPSKIPPDKIQLLTEELEKKLQPAPLISLFNPNQEEKRRIRLGDNTPLEIYLFGFFKPREQQAWSCVSKQQQEVVKKYYQR